MPWKKGVVFDKPSRLAVPGSHKPGKLIDDDTYDVDIQKLQLKSALRSSGVDIDVTEVLTGGQLQDTTTGAPTLELDLLDRDYAALNSGVFGQKVDVSLDEVPFRMTTVSVTGPETLHLLFEHKIVALLREHSDPIKAARSTTTRAQFVHRMLKEIANDFPGLIYVCPEENRLQPLVASKTPAVPSGRSLKSTVVSTQQSAHLTGGGSGTAWRVKVSAEFASSGTGWTELSSNGNGAAAAGHVQSGNCQGGSVGACDFATLGQAFPHGTMMRITGQGGKSAVLPLTDVGNGSSFGPAIGLTPAAAAAVGWDGSSQVTIQLANGQPMNVVSGFGTLVSGVAGSFVTGSSALSVGGGTTQGVYEFTRGTSGTPEDSWTCGQRLASEVQWRFFVSGRRTVYFVTDDDLLLAKSEFDISPDTEGLDHVTMDAEVGRRTIVHKKRRQPKPSTAQVMARVERVEAPPGTVVNLDGYGVGDGKWLVGDITRPLFTPDATIGLYSPQKPLPEPANPTVASTGGTSVSSQTASVSSGGGLPAQPGGYTRVGPGSLLYALATAAVQRFGLRVGQYGPGPGQKYPISSTAVSMVHATNSYHYQGRAADISGSESAMHAFSAFAEQSARPQLLELIHNPGFAVKNGSSYDPGAGPYGGVWAGHINHVHIAA